MHINHEYKQLFIHIPKTGGTSISRSLKGFHTIGFDIAHITLKQIKENMDISGYKIITFIRDPITRFESIYKYLVNEGVVHDTPITFATNIFLGKYNSNFILPMCFFCRTCDLDYIGKFENFENDFKRIFGVTYSPAKLNPTLQKNNIYNDFPNLKDMVRRLYYEDFIEFKYDLQPFVYKSISVTWSVNDLKKSEPEKYLVKMVT